MSKKIIFFGNERFATGVTSKLLIIKALIKLNYEISSVVLSQKPLKENQRNPEIVAFAKENAIPIIYYQDNTALYQQLSKQITEFGILASYGRLIPNQILDLFKGGIINIHPSLLPSHRGPIPLESAILNGDKETGISIIKLTGKLDAGPIYCRQKIALNKTTSKQELANILDKLGSDLVLKFFDDITSKKLLPKPQSTAHVTYDKPLVKSDSWLDPLKKTAQQLERQIRAYEFWPKSILKINDLSLIILKAHSIKGNAQPGTIYLKSNIFGIYALEGILIIDVLIPPGRNKMSSLAFLAGYKSKLLH